MGSRDSTRAASPLLDEEQVAALRGHMRQTLGRYPRAEWFPWLRAFYHDAKRRESALLLAAVESLSREFSLPLAASPGRGDHPASTG